MANFYAISSSSSLAYHHFEEYKNSNIEDDTGQLPVDIALGGK